MNTQCCFHQHGGLYSLNLKVVKVIDKDSFMCGQGARRDTHKHMQWEAPCHLIICHSSLLCIAEYASGGGVHTHIQTYIE